MLHYALHFLTLGQPNVTAGLHFVTLGLHFVRFCQPNVTISS